MILRRYGTAYHSVVPHFESKALNEIGFRRDHDISIPVEEFEADWVQVSEHALDARAEGPVQDEAEQELLADLLEQLTALEEAGEDEALVVESEQGKDWPKSRHEQKNVIVEGENRLYFHLRVEPPLRVGVYRRGG